MASILIVDDQACVRQLLTAELTLEGYCAASVGDTESVISHILSCRPDLVLLDLCLDGLEGFSLFDDIKRQNPDLPVIIYTAYDSYAGDPHLSQADGYVIKSIDHGELKQKVAEVLVRQRTVKATLEPQQRCPELCLPRAFGRICSKTSSANNDNKDPRTPR